ncbi:MAG TPA: pseudouridine synthase, partial [Aestuariivirgaceae bacterium]|nr:pseudouridine synthase [Aestuariivirgaceae bacterium]
MIRPPWAAHRRAVKAGTEFWRTPAAFARRSLMAKQEQAPIPDGERLAKVMARAGLCSRREAERWVAEGRVRVNGKLVTSPALNVSQADRVAVDGQPLPQAAETRLWRYHKPTGLVVSHGDPQGRPTVFEILPAELPRVVSIGRLDINTEGLLLLTNDGELARTLELPATGWTRRYRVRAYGRADPAALAGLARGITLKGIRYGPIEAEIDSEKGGNLWLTVALGEGKNREVKLVLEHLGLTVNRLIRVAFGPFQLGDLARGGVDEVSRRVLRDQLGQRLG